MDQQLPLDLPSTEEELFGWTTCGYEGCKRGPIRRTDAIETKKWNGRDYIVEHFCSEEHATEFYLERIRSSGL